MSIKYSAFWLVISNKRVTANDRYEISKKTRERQKHEKPLKI